jgi:hypothetical protein
MSSITSANAVLTLKIPGISLYAQGKILQGFSAEDVFGMDAIDPAELSMGIDGNLSAAFIFVPTKQAIHLQADSASNAVFEDLRAAEVAGVEKLPVSMTVAIPAVKKIYTCVTGYLTSYPPISDAKKSLQPRKYEITWQTVTVATTA